MSGRILVSGRLLYDDRRFLDDYIQGSLPSYAVFATRSLMLRWRGELLRRLPGHAMGGEKLLLFPGLADLILGEETNRPVDEGLRLAVMEMVLGELRREGRLKVLDWEGGARALAREILITVDALRRGMVPADALAKAGRGAGRLSDLLLCWHTYDKRMSMAGWIEPDISLARAIGHVLQQQPLTPRITGLLVHGFTDFYPLEARLLCALAERGLEIIVLWPGDQGHGGTEAQTRDLPSDFPHWTMEPLDAQAGTPLRDDGFFSCYGGVAKAMGKVHLLEGEGETALASLIARTIHKSMAADPTLTYEQIAVVSRDQDAGGTCAAVLKRHGLPVSETTGRILLGYNSIGTILAALACSADDWPRPSMLRLARGMFVGAEAPMADALARYANQNGLVRTRAAWEDTIALEGLESSDVPNDDDVKQARHAIGRLAGGLMLFSTTASTADYLAGLRAFIAYWDWPACWWPGETGAADLEVYAGEVRALQRLLGIVEEMALAEQTIGQSRVWTISDWLGELERIAASSYLADSSTGNMIRCLDPSEARGLRFRLVFLTGLAEGEFPRQYREDWLLTEELRGLLLGRGYGLESRSTLAAREWHLLSAALTAGENTYLCWSLVDAKGESRTPSVFLAYLREKLILTPQDKLRGSEILPRDHDEAWDEASIKGRLLVDLLWNEPSLEEAAAVLASYTLHRRDLAGIMAKADAEIKNRSGPDLNLGDTDNPAIMADLALRFSEEKTLSVSALEDYASCPFSFYGRRILLLDALHPSEEEPSGLDLGQAYHGSLERFFRRMAGESLSTEHQAEYMRLLAEAVTSSFAFLHNQAKTPQARRLIGMSEELCLQRLQGLVRAEIRMHRRRGPWRTVHCELGFGLSGRGLDPASTSRPLSIRSEDTVLNVSGKIDRVDFLPGGYYLVYDYKLGRPPDPGQVLAGKSLQILLYLLACRECFFPALQPAGGGYYSLRDLNRNSGLYREELSDLTGITTRAGGSLTASEWNRVMTELTGRLLSSARGIRSGCFPVSQDGCPSYCAFKSVCRKEES